MTDLIAQIDAAFGARPYPGDDNITHHPCTECAEMAAYFKGRSWRSVTGEELRLEGQGDSLFTVPAYCYFLPAYLTAAIREPEAADVCVDHLTYRFGPKEDDAWGRGRLGEILSELSRTEREAALAYFRFELSRDPEDFQGFCARAIRGLEATL